jgi:hypothetical protein
MALLSQPTILSQESGRQIRDVTMTTLSTNKKDMIDIAPAQSHIHQEVRGMYDKVLVTREPYGKPGTFDHRSYPSGEAC